MVSIVPRMKNQIKPGAFIRLIRNCEIVGKCHCYYMNLILPFGYTNSLELHCLIWQSLAKWSQLILNFNYLKLNIISLLSLAMFQMLSIPYGLVTNMLVGTEVFHHLRKSPQMVTPLQKLLNAGVSLPIRIFAFLCRGSQTPLESIQVFPFKTSSLNSHREFPVIKEPHFLID